jgi:2,3-dimethylmalate lyase
MLLPGVHDALSARLAEQAGFSAVYMSGSAVTASLLGQPDIGMITQTEMVEQARRIVEAVEIPLICDADTGYGNPLNTRRTVRLFESAGVAGIQLEDQTFPKRCGHFDRKEVISLSDMVAKLSAAIDTRRDESFVLIARTDARAVRGLDEAIERGLAYGEVGADIIFIEAPQSEDELRRIARAVSYPLLVNMVEGGRTPQLSFEALADLGFKIVLYPTAGIRSVMKTLRLLYQDLLTAGSTVHLLDQLVGFDERNEITGLAFFEALEDRYRSDS